MTDDFIFGDDSDEHDADDERELFGARSDESRESTDTDRRFGTSTTDDTDFRSVAERVRTAVTGRTHRTATIIALALALVVVFGLVAYPFVMGAFDAANTGETDASAGGGVGETPDVTPVSETVTTAVETPPATNVPTAMPTATTTVTASQPTETTSATPTPTPTPTTPVPTRGFPAGTPAEANETTD